MCEVEKVQISHTLMDLLFYMLRTQSCCMSSFSVHGKTFSTFVVWFVALWTVNRANSVNLKHHMFIFIWIKVTENMLYVTRKQRRKNKSCINTFWLLLLFSWYYCSSEWTGVESALTGRFRPVLHVQHSWCTYLWRDAGSKQSLYDPSDSGISLCRFCCFEFDSESDAKSAEHQTKHQFRLCCHFVVSPFFKTNILLFTLWDIVFVCLSSQNKANKHYYYYISIHKSFTLLSSRPKQRALTCGPTSPSPPSSVCTICLHIRFRLIPPLPSLLPSLFVS